MPRDQTEIFGSTGILVASAGVATAAIAVKEVDGQMMIA